MSPGVMLAVLAVIVALVALAAVLVLARRPREPETSRLDAGLGLLQQQVSDLRETLSRSLEAGQQRVDHRLETVSRGMDERIEASRRTLDQRLEATMGVVQQVQRSLGEVNASVQGFVAISRDIRALQDILKAPKLRGGLGEYFLGDLLAQILPPRQFSLQHGFSTGERVDAVIRAGDRLVPVDAKFPLENFRRVVQAETDEARRRERRNFLADVRKHVSDIASKYIRPDEGTYDFALMYIPAENVYYEAVLRDEELEDDKGVLSFALTKRVIPVSPNSFYAYLQVILIGLQGLRIEAQARQILEQIQTLRGDLGRFGEDFGIVGKHLSNALGKYEDAAKKLERLTTRLESLVEPRAAPLPPAAADAARGAGSEASLPLEPADERAVGPDRH